MRLRNQTQHWTGAALALLLPAAALANETHVYGIANFGGAGQCNADSHSVHTQTAAEFAGYFNSLVSSGLWSDVRTLNNSSARTDLWTDLSKGPVADAKDTQANAGVDDADVFFVHTHGGHSEASQRSWLVMGSNADACAATTDLHMNLGNGKLDIAVVKACQSGDLQVWKDGGYKQLVTSSSGFSMWNAFHGDSSCGNFVKRYVKRYVKNSRGDGVGENWIDEAYDWDLGKNNDDCPVSIVFGQTKAQRVAMFEFGGWRDRKPTGSKVGSTYFFVGGCDPSSGQKLPE
ncbi:hypothetical protein D7X96_12735 [Corallococcus interemptor]|uniref:Caspase family protein n=1 Tax=Corallococcus interemptor TaxID=2316720 RepID=A0A3A8QNE5_9BACT|nr:hypothetical protein [Corallococcus interemptor]RKH50470.1 hypothetical protein D7Y23_13095 [Corallococcus sp. AB050B]RKH70193.1 hypothetical protein D7X96_12735 [Corallococcus interemptor]